MLQEEGVGLDERSDGAVNLVRPMAGVAGVTGAALRPPMRRGAGGPLGTCVLELSDGVTNRVLPTALVLPPGRLGPA